jgi:hypothetical protein
MSKEARKHSENKSKYSLKLKLVHLDFLFENLEKTPTNIRLPKLIPFKNELLQQAEETKKKQVSISR